MLLLSCWYFHVTYDITCVASTSFMNPLPRPHGILNSPLLLNIAGSSMLSRYFSTTVEYCEYMNTVNSDILMKPIVFVYYIVKWSYSDIETSTILIYNTHFSLFNQFISTTIRKMKYSIEYDFHPLQRYQPFVFL